MDDNKPKITYLFGAGASAQKLPTIKELPDRIKIAKEYLEANYIFEDNEIYSALGFEFKKNDAKDYVLKGFDKLYNASQNHSTVDTFAKKLSLNNKNLELHELTFILALYFNVDQKINGYDPRYNTFLISILNSSVFDFPENLKFLSWNYDLQFEMAYDYLLERRSRELDFRKFNTNQNDWDKTSFTSIKINGSCNVIQTQGSQLFPLVNNLLNKRASKDDIDFCLKYSYFEVEHQSNSYKYRININFAWYKDSGFIEKVSELHNETNVLVVIGYSFPFFNREVDRKIIQSMKNLKKIYIQDIHPENIVTRFLSILPDWKIRGIEIIPVNSVDEFFLPPEL